jgi:hypothetical protein
MRFAVALIGLAFLLAVIWFSMWLGRPAGLRHGPGRAGSAACWWRAVIDGDR